MISLLAPESLWFARQLVTLHILATDSTNLLCDHSHISCVCVLRPGALALLQALLYAYVSAICSGTGLFPHSHTDTTFLRDGFRNKINVSAKVFIIVA